MFRRHSDCQNRCGNERGKGQGHSLTFSGTVQAQRAAARATFTLPPATVGGASNMHSFNSLYPYPYRRGPSAASMPSFFSAQTFVFGVVNSLPNDTHPVGVYVRMVSSACRDTARVPRGGRHTYTYRNFFCVFFMFRIFFCGPWVLMTIRIKGDSLKIKKLTSPFTFPA